MNNKTKPSKGMKTFFVIWFGQFISTLGSGLTGFAISIWVYEQTGSVTQYALNILAANLPIVILSPFAGALVDRFNRRIMMMVSDIGAGISTILIWMLLLSGNLEVWHVYLLTALNAAFSSIQWPAYSAATTQLVPKEHLGRASGMVQIGEAVSQLASPAIAGGLYLTVGLSGIVTIDLFTMLAAVGTLLLIRIPDISDTKEVKEKSGSIWREISFGFKYIWERKGLFNLLMYFASLNFLGGFVGPLLTPLLLSYGSTDEVGLVYSTIGAGMLVGTLLMSMWGGPKNRVLGILVPGFLQGIFLAFVAFRESLVLAAVCGFFFMLVNPILNGSSQALWQSKVKPEIQGRVFSVRRLLASFTSPIAILMAGPLVDNLLQPMMNENGALAGTVGALIGVGDGRGTALCMIIVGLLTSLSTLIGFTIPSMRNIQRDLPDAVEDDESIVLLEAEPEPSYT